VLVLVLVWFWFFLFLFDLMKKKVGGFGFVWLEGVDVFSVSVGSIFLFKVGNLNGM
jgi:hypothetical protein